METLEQDPQFHFSSFALVPKKGAPLHLDGRIIHDLSAPQGTSVNDLTDTSASPDARWDLFLCIALRVRDLRRRYPGRAIYVMVADIAEAFKHVPVHARHASAFGAVFGWTSSPGFFAVFGKAVRHYQRTKASRILGDLEPFWIFQWVYDIVLIEVDIDVRLLKAGKRLRDGIKLVFGSVGWHEKKFTSWSQKFHAVGIDWSIPEELISIPQRKIDKTHKIISEIASKKFVTMKELGSLVGVLRHIISFIPITKPFIQRLVAVQTRCRRRHQAGVAMTDFLRKDLTWWKDLVFQNEFAGIPMALCEHHATANEIWLLQSGCNGIIITSMALRERAQLSLINPDKGEVEVARTILKVTTKWGPRLEVADPWHHIVIHRDYRWITRVIDKMNCGLQRAKTDCTSAGSRNRIEEKPKQLKRAAVTDGTLTRYSKNFKYWESFCNDFGFPMWIDELPRAQQARMVGQFAGLCASEGHNRAKTGSKYQTFDGKMAAVASVHKAVRNARLDYHDPEFDLVSQGYKRTISQVDRKQPVTTPILRKMRELVQLGEPQDQLTWGSIVLGFFFLDRISEQWGPVTIDKSTGADRVHCVKACNVIIRDKHGRQVSSSASEAYSVEVLFESHKGDRIGQGVTIRHYRSHDTTLCPVRAAQSCLQVRAKWLAEKVVLGPYLTSISRKKTIKKAKVAGNIKTAAKSMGLSSKDYSCHSLRIGGACALLAAGKGDLVIKLMGSWSSWCFSVYTRLQPGMIRDAASSMIKASTWECHKPSLTPLEGEPGSLTLRADQVYLPHSHRVPKEESSPRPTMLSFPRANFDTRLILQLTRHSAPKTPSTNHHLRTMPSSSEICAFFFKEGADFRYTCKICNGERKQAPATGYSNLLSHLATKHPNYLTEMASAQRSQNGSMKTFGFVPEPVDHLYRWMRWVVQRNHPLCKVDDPLTRAMSRLRPTTSKTLRTTMQSVAGKIGKVIEKEMGDRFGVVSDGWAHGSTHYLALFAVYTSGGALWRPLLSVSPLDDGPNC